MATARSLPRFFARVFAGHKHCIPHPEKAQKGGEDAMFLARRAAAVAVECYINCYLGVHFAPNLAWPLLDFTL